MATILRDMLSWERYRLSFLGKFGGDDGWLQFYTS
jgi:hypothetical protein